MCCGTWLGILELVPESVFSCEGDGGSAALPMLIIKSIIGSFGGRMLKGIISHLSGSG